MAAAFYCRSRSRSRSRSASLALFLRFFFFLLLSLFLSSAAVTATDAKQPISVPVSEYWDGYDGPWSSFQISVGTPSQILRVLPASDQVASWVILPEACAGTDYDAAQCRKGRGFTFDNTTSTTWKNKGLFELSLWPLESSLGLTGNGAYGFDTLTIGWTDDGPSRSQQILAGIVAEDFWIGTLGLNPRLINFTTVNDNWPSFMASLQNGTSAIPSTSWSYTAGSYNRSPKVYGSLTLGGYDSTRFEDNDVTFPFGADQSYDFQVGVQDIYVNSARYTPLLTEQHFTFLNTLTPYIWLPNDTCTAFEEEFGLVWNETAGLYLINDTLHDTLLQRAPEVVFRLGPALNGDSVTVTLPYTSLYLTAGSELIPNGTETNRFFPIKRAANDTQYIFGRAFLQSAYMIANYDKYSFSLHQALYPNTTTPANLVAIDSHATNSTNSTSTDTDADDAAPSLSAGAIAGIAVGAAVGVALLGLAAYLLFRHRPRGPGKRSGGGSGSEGSDRNAHAVAYHEVASQQREELENGTTQKHEMVGDHMPRAELMQKDGRGWAHELDDGRVKQFPAASPLSSEPAELEGSVVGGGGRR